MGVLLASVPLVYRILAILALCVALFGYGFIKGVVHQKGLQEVAAAEAFAQSVMDANTRAKASAKAQFEAASLRDKLKAKDAASKAQLKEMLASREKYRSCEIDQDVFNKLNED